MTTCSPPFAAPATAAFSPVASPPGPAASSSSSPAGPAVRGPSPMPGSNGSNSPPLQPAPIERGEIIRRSDVELRPHAGALPKQAVASLDAIVGKEAVQGIRADSLLQANQVRSPLVVRRGERVAVRARTGGISVRTYALAQQDGALGDLVTVQSLEGKEQYAARVSGLRELEIFAAGAEVREIAAADTQPATSRK